MKRSLLLSVLLTCGIGPAWGATPVMVQDFEKATLQPSVWVVNIPNENASVQLSTDHPHDGKQCLKLHYHFLGTGNFQYLGIPNKIKIQARVHKLHFWLKGDNSKCSYGVQVTDASGETHQYSPSGTGQGGIIDFTRLERGRHRPGRSATRRGVGTRTARSIIRSPRLPSPSASRWKRPAERETVARRGRPVLRFPQRRFREERGGDLGLPGVRGLARRIAPTCRETPPSRWRPPASRA